MKQVLFNLLLAVFISGGAANAATNTLHDKPLKTVPASTDETYVWDTGTSTLKKTTFAPFLVGDCTGFPCLDGTSDGGNYIKLWAGTGSYWTALQGGSPAANRSWRLPIAAPPAAGTTYLMNMDEYGQMGFVDPDTLGGGATAINDLTDVDTTGKATGKILKFDSSGNLVVGDDATGSGSVPSGTVNGQVLIWATDQWVANTPSWLTTASLGTGVASALGYAPDTAGGFLLYSTYADDPVIAWDSATITETVNSPAAGTNTIGVKSGVFQAYDADWLGVTANGASLISASNYAAMRALLDLEPGADYDAATPSTLNLASDTDITASQLLSNKFISNQGASGEVDITLPAVSYSITRTVLVEETQIVEINPPSGEAFDLSGTMLDANDCIDSPTVVGAKAVFTRMQDASGVWHWSVDQVRGTWVDTGASD